jgi:allantoicase
MSTISVLSHDDFVAQISSKYTDVIGAKLGGKIISFSDEWFAEAKNLIQPSLPIRQVGKFTPAGAWYDGWETRRHNPEPADWVIIKLGVASATIIGTEIDTAFFNGNHAPAISVEGTFVADDKDLDSAKWEEIIAQTECGPSQRHFFARAELTKAPYTHVRLKQYPDGGIARFRLYGKPIAVFPADLNEEIDLAHVSSGGIAVAFSDQHFGAVDNLLIPGRGKDMGDGWETKRSREPGHVDWVTVKLGAPGYVDRVVVDTAHFIGNYPQSITVHAINNPDADPTNDDANWKLIIDKTKTGPHKIHEYIRANATSASSAADVTQKVLTSGKDEVFTHVKLTIIPDGGVKRFRVFGRRASA